MKCSLNIPVKISEQDSRTASLATRTYPWKEGEVRLSLSQHSIVLLTGSGIFLYNVPMSNLKGRRDLFKQFRRKSQGSRSRKSESRHQDLSLKIGGRPSVSDSVSANLRDRFRMFKINVPIS